MLFNIEWTWMNIREEWSNRIEQSDGCERTSGTASGSHDQSEGTICWSHASLRKRDSAAGSEGYVKAPTEVDVMSAVYRRSESDECVCWR